MIYCDNIDVTCFLVNPTFHSKMKHIEIDYHFVHDHVSYVSMKDKLVDIPTKPMSRH